MPFNVPESHKGGLIGNVLNNLGGFANTLGSSFGGQGFGGQGLGSGNMQQSVNPNGARYGGLMQPSMPQRGDMNQTQNPFSNGGIAPTPQVAPEDIQKKIDDAIAALKQSQPQQYGGSGFDSNGS
jgi:hypothetical protein